VNTPKTQIQSEDDLPLIAVCIVLEKLGGKLRMDKMLGKVTEPGLSAAAMVCRAMAERLDELAQDTLTSHPQGPQT
jgi:hypothetical protein